MSFSDEFITLCHWNILCFHTVIKTFCTFEQNKGGFFCSLTFDNPQETNMSGREENTYLFYIYQNANPALPRHRGRINTSVWFTQCKHTPSKPHPVALTSEQTCMHLNSEITDTCAHTFWRRRHPIPAPSLRSLRLSSLLKHYPKKKR